MAKRMQKPIREDEQVMEGARMLDTTGELLRQLRFGEDSSLALRELRIVQGRS